MCGIIGIVGGSPVAPRLIDSLKRLEYRGYDSAGVAAIVDGRIERRRAPGKLRELEKVLAAEPLGGTTGIGHTRWATHGAPSLRNAHPQRAGRVAVAHNGIIENFASLKAELIAEGRNFESDTDSEVVAHLIDREVARGARPVAAFQAVLRRLHGAYALAVLIEGEPELVLGARRSMPLAVGWGEGEMYLGSDALALAPFTNRVTFLEEGDGVAIDRASARIFDAEGAAVERLARTVSISPALAEKGNFRHFMEKEIHDQPEACQHTLASYLDPTAERARAPQGLDLRRPCPYPDPGLRHRLLRRNDRQILDREPRRPAGRCGDRL